MRRWRLFVLPLAVLGSSTLADGCLREDELDCERAVSQLQACCPGFEANETLQCNYVEGCGVTEPAISIADAECILAESCEEIRANQICERALNLKSPSSAPVGTASTTGPGGSSPVPNMVCP